MRLWDTQSCELRCVLRGQDAVRVAFSPDGHYLCAASSFGERKVREYLVDVEQLLVLAARRASRTLTPEERAAYLVGDLSSSG
jgi:hypothetical protein